MEEKQNLKWNTEEKLNAMYCLSMTKINGRLNILKVICKSLSNILMNSCCFFVKNLYFNELKIN